MIAILHAYSRANSGDGLLVDLTLARLAAVGIEPSDVVLVALDPDSFPDLPRRVRFGTPGRRPDTDLAIAGLRSATLALASRRSWLGRSDVSRVFAEADGFVAVGGGYLRSGSAVNRWGTRVNHLAQLDAAVRSGRPVIYLPQSVGPLPGRQGERIRTYLHRVTAAHLRDDRSITDVGVGPGIHRTPDLAVLELAQRGEVSARPPDGSPVLVARALPRAAGYPDLLIRLSRILTAATGACRWAVQSAGSAEKSDATFYRDELDVAPTGTLREVLAGPRPGVVVSVRLHGALEAVLAGVPAIHLGYERKSWGAYDDLGLRRWLHPARHFDPAAVAAQVSELMTDPTSYWESVSDALPRLRQASERLDDSLARSLGR